VADQQDLTREIDSYLEERILRFEGLVEKQKKK
jgi:hypothetical protein